MTINYENVFPCIRCKKPTEDTLCSECALYLTEHEPEKDEYEILEDYFINQMDDLNDRERVIAIINAIHNLKEQKKTLRSLR
jgi:predicted amidophosphoribosyltransferase